MTDAMTESGRDHGATGTATVYVTWGGTGRAASLRNAIRSAAQNNSALVVLAVLDPDGFSDLDDSFAVTVANELEWLLSAQIELARTQLNLPDLESRIVTRRGDVSAEVIAVAQECGARSVLVGAPTPVSGHESVDALMSHLGRELRCPVDLVAP